MCSSTPLRKACSTCSTCSNTRAQLVGSLPSNTANQRVCSFASSANLSVIVIGTHRTIPTRPNILPQRIRERKTTSVDNPTPRPTILGSMTVPTTIFTARYPTATSKARPKPNWMSAYMYRWNGCDHHTEAGDIIEQERTEIPTTRGNPPQESKAKRQSGLPWSRSRPSSQQHSD